MISDETTIIHISDLHIDGLGPNRQMSTQGWQAMADALRRLHPDLVVVTGDLTTHGSCHIEHLYQAREFLDSIGVDYLVIPGNHDLSPSADVRADECYENVPWKHTRFCQVFSQSPAAARTLGPVSVIGLALREGDPDGALTGLQSTLAAAPGPVLVFGHYPLRTVRTQGVLSAFGWTQYIPGTLPEFRRILKSAPQVRLYGCGHVHAASVMAITPSLAQISAGGLGPGPSQFWLYKITSGDLAFFSMLAEGPPLFWNGENLAGADPCLYNWGDIRTGRIALTPSHSASLSVPH